MIIFSKCSSNAVTKTLPPKLFIPDKETADTIDILFASLQSNNSTNAYPNEDSLHISTIPVRFRSEIASLFRFENDTLSKSHFNSGITGLVHNYLSSCFIIHVSCVIVVFELDLS